MEEKLPRALPRDVPDYHDRQAAHFRALASTTWSVQATLPASLSRGGHSIRAWVALGGQKRGPPGGGGTLV